MGDCVLKHFDTASCPLRWKCVVDWAMEFWLRWLHRDSVARVHVPPRPQNVSREHTDRGHGPVHQAALADGRLLDADHGRRKGAAKQVGDPSTALPVLVL